MNNLLSADKYYQMWVLIHRTSDAMFKARKKALRQSGISPMQVAVLFFIKIIDGVATPGEISRWMFRESHTISEILNRMGKRGLIKRINHPNKKSNVGVVISEKGQKIFEEAMKKQVVKQLILALSDEEQRQLSLLLGKLLDKSLKELKFKNNLPWF